MEKKELKVIIMIGLSGSGKSTWAREYCRKHENFVIVSRDSFRYMLKNAGFCDPKTESMINELMENAISKALKFKYNVIVDNTHLRASRINEIVRLVEYSADVEFMLLDVPVKKCIERDAERPNKVGAGVITEQNEDFKVLKDSFVFQNLKRKPSWQRPRVIPKMSSPLDPAVIFDIDGTLAYMHNRGPFDWDKVDRDHLNEVVAEHVRFHKEAGRKIIIVTGRDEAARSLTSQWLEFYGVYFDKLLMRPKDDFRKDSVVKKEIFLNYIKDKYNVICVYDDRLQVVDAWRKLGLWVFNCDQTGVEF